MTPLETKRAELARLLEVLHESSEKIVRQNEDHPLSRDARSDDGLFESSVVL